MPLALMGTMIALIYKREHPKWLGHNRVNIGNFQLGSTHVNIDGYPSMKKIT
jgi:hypothetical protein